MKTASNSPPALPSELPRSWTATASAAATLDPLIVSRMAAVRIWISGDGGRNGVGEDGGEGWGEREGEGGEREREREGYFLYLFNIVSIKILKNNK